METMLSFADSSSSSQDEADDEEEESGEEEEEEKENEDWVKPTDDGEDCEELTNGKHRSLSLVRTEFSSQPDLPTFIQVSMHVCPFMKLLVK